MKTAAGRTDREGDDDAVLQSKRQAAGRYHDGAGARRIVQIGLRAAVLREDLALLVPAADARVAADVQISLPVDRAKQADR